MSSVIEMLAGKKKAQVSPATVILPVVQKEHEGECGDGCACGEAGDDGACCGG
jgi:hypothetical protein